MNYLTTILINLEFKTTNNLLLLVYMCVRVYSIKNCSHVLQLYPCTGPCCFCIQQNDLQERKLGNQLACMCLFFSYTSQTQHLFNKFKSCTYGVLLPLAAFSLQNLKTLQFLHNHKCLVIYGIQKFNPIKYYLYITRVCVSLQSSNHIDTHSTTQRTKAEYPLKMKETKFNQFIKEKRKEKVANITIDFSCLRLYFLAFVISRSLALFRCPAWPGRRGMKIFLRKCTIS